MGEDPCVLMKRALGGAGEYNFEGGGGERRSLCGERVIVGGVITGWGEGKI